MNKKKFAFLIHPRQIKDFGRRVGILLKVGEWLGMMIPAFILKWLMKRFPPFGICSEYEINGAKGYIITLHMTAGDMMNSLKAKKLARKRILDAVLYAQNELGVEVIGLGAYTAPITDNGAWITKQKGVTCTITHGDALSAYTIMPILNSVIEAKKINISEATVAIVGAYGLIGRAVANLISEIGPKKIILTGPQILKLEKVKQELLGIYQGEVICYSSDTPNQKSESAYHAILREADILILSTTASGTLVKSDMLKYGAVVVDMSQPHNMCKSVCKVRPDVTRVDGGYINIGTHCGFEMGPPRNVTFACHAETILLALSGNGRHHVGPVDIDFAKKIWLLAVGTGFKLAPLSNFSKPIDLVSSDSLAAT